MVQCYVHKKSKFNALKALCWGICLMGAGLYVVEAKIFFIFLVSACIVLFFFCDEMALKNKAAKKRNCRRIARRFS